MTRGVRIPRTGDLILLHVSGTELYHSTVSVFNVAVPSEQQVCFFLREMYVSAVYVWMSIAHKSTRRVCM